MKHGIANEDVPKKKRMLRKKSGNLLNAWMARSQVEWRPRKGPQLFEGIISAIVYTTGIMAMVKLSSRIIMKRELERLAR